MLNRSALVVAIVLCSCEPTNQGYAPEQPIKYSHAVHAGALQIDCEYCHYAAERGPHAGIPPAQVCMNCHDHVAKDHPEVLKIKEAIDSEAPIEWVRVHWLPDHVFFDHSIHIASGVGCTRCHGEVESMGRVAQAKELTMGWCLSCHRDVSSEAMGEEVRASPLTDCAVCHH